MRAGRAGVCVAGRVLAFEFIASFKFQPARAVCGRAGIVNVRELPPEDFFPFLPRPPLPLPDILVVVVVV